MNRTEKQARLWAAIGTVAVVGVAILLMLTSYMSLSSLDIAMADKGEIVLAEEEEFVEVVQTNSMPDMVGDSESISTADEQLESQPTPISGTDVDDAGPAGEPAPVVTQDKTESEMKIKQEREKELERQKAQAAAEKKRREQEEMKRQANNEIANAFNKSQGKHNNAVGSNDKGNNGTPNGNAPQGSLTGHGTGKVGGGWAIPQYGAVTSTVTGSVKMVLTIDRNGNVTNVRFDGGDAPAATNTAVRNACRAEVMARKFTRSNYDDAPETSTAYITYTFR